MAPGRRSGAGPRLRIWNTSSYHLSLSWWSPDAPSVTCSDRAQQKPLSLSPARLLAQSDTGQGYISPLSSFRLRGRGSPGGVWSGRKAGHGLGGKVAAASWLGLDAKQAHRLEAAERGMGALARRGEWADLAR